MTREKTPGGLPLYPRAVGSEIDIETLAEATGQTVPPGVDIALYTVEASTGEVLAWYRAQMSEQGWTKMAEVPIPGGVCLAYMKGDKAAGIVVLTYLDQTFLVLMHGSLEKLGPAPS